jgi:hypothetical protein
MSSLYRYDHLQLNQGIARQCVHADGCAHVAARFTEYFQQEVRRSVDDRGRIRKSRNRIDVAIHADNLLNLVERSQRMFENGELGQRARARGGIALGNAAIGRTIPSSSSRFSALMCS